MLLLECALSGRQGEILEEDETFGLFAGVTCVGDSEREGSVGLESIRSIAMIGKMDEDLHKVHC